MTTFDQETVRVCQTRHDSENQRQNLSGTVMVRGENRVQSKVMSEMRRHLVQMNREKMIEKGTITAKELAILGKYSDFTDLATMDFTSETADSSSNSSGSSAASRLWRELLY